MVHLCVCVCVGGWVGACAGVCVYVALGRIKGKQTEQVITSSELGETELTKHRVN